MYRDVIRAASRAMKAPPIRFRTFAAAEKPRLRVDELLIVEPILGLSGVNDELRVA
jgi:hypothetical protein